MRQISRILALELGLLLLLSSCCHKVTAYANWKAVECKSLNTSFCTIKCHVKPERRNVASLNLHVNILDSPITEFSVHVDFKKRANGWKPFLYNFKMDACRFLASKNKNPVANYFYEYMGLRTHSNLNHSCPFHDDIIITNHTFPATMRTSQNLPLPSGYYGLFTTWFSGGKARLKANGFLTVDE